MLSGLSSRSPAGHVGPHGIVRQRTQSAGERGREILERRSQRRSHPASPGGGALRRRPSATPLEKPPRQPISPQRPPASTRSRQCRLKKSVPVPRQIGLNSRQVTAFSASPAPTGQTGEFRQSCGCLFIDLLKNLHTVPGKGSKTAASGPDLACFR